MNKKERIEIAEMEQQKESDLAIANTPSMTGKGKIHFPEYWAKRKHRLNPVLLKRLQATADAAPEVTDAYGEYKTGTFLHRSCIVTVKREDGIWSCHIFNNTMPIALPVIQEVRDKFVPDNVTMVQLFPSREERKGLKGVMLYEFPTNQEASEECSTLE